MDVLGLHGIDDLLSRALAEDVGQGDITTAATVRAGQRGSARIVVKEGPILFCGGPVLQRVFELSGSRADSLMMVEEGAALKAGDVAVEIEGLLAGLLTGERTALNFIQLMSGIATLTGEFVQRVHGTRARIVDTRKTHPGLRSVEKYAVRIG